MKLRWTLRALRRLDEIGTYVSEHNPPAAARLIRRIAEQTRTLACIRERAVPAV